MITIIFNWYIYTYIVQVLVNETTHYHLDILWPKLDDGDAHTMSQVLAINQATNKIKGARFQGIGLTIELHDSGTIEGFIDIYRDITATTNITTWAKERFISK